MGEVSESFTITVLDAYGNEALTTLSTTFSLTSNTTGTGSYYSDSEGNSALAGNEITIGAGEGTAEFYYSDTEVNTGTVVTATPTAGDDIGSDTHSIDINSTNATKLAIADLTDPITAGTLGTFKVQIHDADDEQSPASSDVTVNLSSDQAEGRFYADADDFDSENPATNAISEITISQGDTQSELWYYGTSAGNHELTAEDNGEDLNLAAESTTVIAADAADLALTADPLNPAAGSNSLLTATVTDAFGNPVENEEIDFSIKTGNGSFDGTFSGVSTNAAGEAAAVYQTHTTIETADLQAELSENDAITDEITITSVAGDAAKYIVTVSDETPEAGSEITVNAQLADENDNAVSDEGRTVNWSADNGGSFASNSSQTDENGIAEIIFTVSGTSSITHQIAATDNVDGDITGTKSVTTKAGDPAQFTLSGPGDVEAGEVSGIFTITLQDSEGNTTTAGTGGITFNLSSTDSEAAIFYEDEGEGVITTVEISEGESGKGFYYSNETSGEQTITVADNNEDDGLGSNTADITVTPSVLHEFTVTGIDDPAIAGDENSVTVTALDQFSNIKTDYTGIISFSSSDEKADLPSDYTFVEGDNGSHTFINAVILKTAGEQWVQAADDDKTGRQEDITVNPAEVDVSNTNTKLEVITNNVEANGTAEAEVRATLLDEFDNPVPGTSVTFSADGDAQLEDATGTTNLNGQVTVAITNTTAEEVDVTAVYGDGNTSIINGSPAEVTFINGAAAKLAFVQNPSAAIAGDTLSPSITVQLLDALDNPVDTDDVEITLSISGDATLVGTLSQNTSDGLATFDDLYVIEPGENYTLSAESENLDSGESGTFNITRRSITITAEGKSKTYGEDDPEFTYELTSGTLIPDVDLSGELGRATGEDVDSYVITQSTLTNANNSSYDITFESDNLEITPRNLTLSNFTASDKTYDGDNTATAVNFDDNRIADDDLEFDFTAAFEDENAGDDKTVNITDIEISGGAKKDNYNLVTSEGEATVDIHKKELTAGFTASDKTYDGTTSAAIESRSVNGAVEDDDVVLTGGTAAFADKNVGTEKTVMLTGATLSGTAADNYSLSTDVITSSADILAKALTITASNQSKTYGTAFTFDDNDFTTTELIEGDDVTSVTLTSAGASKTADVASYDINVNDATGAGLSNYDITYAVGTFTVNKATLTVTADDQEKSYDGNVFTEFTVSYDGFADGEDAGDLSGMLAFGGTSDGAKNVGEYTIIPSGLSSTNYNIIFDADTLEITPRDLSLSNFTASAKTYDGTTTAAGVNFDDNRIDGEDLEFDYTAAFEDADAGEEKTVNITGITISGGDDAGNYNLVTTGGEATTDINKKELTAEFTASNKTYDGTTSATIESQSVNGSVDGDDVELTGGTAAFADKNVGTEKIVTLTGATLSGDDADNYSLSDDGITTTADITAKALTITADDQSKIYDGSAFTAFTASYDGFVGEDAAEDLSGTLAFGGTSDGAVDAGEYAITPSGLSSGNYDISFDEGNLTINKATLTVTADDQSKTYGSDDPEYTVSYTGFENGEDAEVLGGTLNVFRTAGEDVGTYTLTPSGLTSDNYELSYATGALDITKAALTVTADDQGKIYDGAAFTNFTVSYDGFVAGDDEESLSGALTYTYSGASDGATDAGSYTIIPGGVTSGNYDITFDEGNLTINKAALTVTADDDSKTYGEDDPAFTVSYAGFENEEDATDLGGELAISRTAGENVGTYTITPGGLSSDNYELSYETGSLSITPKALTITAENQSKTYGEDFNFNSTEFSTDGLVDGDEVTSITLASDGISESAAVEEYDIEISDATGTGLDNYTITYNAGKLTVEKVELTITAENKSKTYDGSAFTAFTVNFDGFVDGDAADDLGGTLAFVGTSEGAVDAGTYTIIPEGLTSGNYDISFENGSLTIDKAALTVLADDDSKTYGEDDPEYTVSYAGFKNEEAAEALGGTLAVSRTTGEDVGTYTLTPSGLTSENYEITYATGVLDITKAALTVTADDQGKTYDGAAFTNFTVSYDGFVAGDDEESLSGALTYSGTSDGATDAGSYTIISGGVTSGNYDISFGEGNLTINKATLTVTADDQSKTYGSDDPEYTVSYTGFENGEDAEVLGGILDVSRTAGEDVGTYTLTPSGLSSDNYEITYVTGTLVVNKAALTITADDQEKTYGETLSFDGDEFTSTGLVEGDEVISVTLSSNGASSTAFVDDYDITPSNATGDLDNYEITYATGTLTVNKTALTVTVDDDSKTYGEDDPAFTVNYAGFKNEEDATDLGGELAISRTAGEEVGTYTLILSGLTSGNYEINYTTGTFTVNKAALTITATDQSKTYGAVFTFEGNEFSADGLQNSDEVTSVTLSSDGAIGTASADEYDITPSAATGNGLDNYNITYEAGSLTVGKAALTVTASDQSKTYGAIFTFDGDKLTTTGLQGDDAVTSVTLISDGAVETADVDEYDITPSAATGDGLANYDITYTAGTFTVNKAALTITASDPSKTYDGAAFTNFTVSYDGFVAGDVADDLGGTLAFGGTSDGAVDAGTYTIIPEGLTSDNYNITFENGSLSINKGALTVTADDDSKTYGSDDPEFTVSYAGFKNEEDATDLGGELAISRTAGEDVGTYTITPGGLTSDNYEISVEDGSLEITKVPLTITADNQSKTYDGAAFTNFTVSYDGFVAGDAADDLSGTLTFGGNADGAENVGEYAITAAGLISDNYTISFENGSLSINEAALTITADNQTKTYGENFDFNGTEFSTAGLVDGDAVTSVTLTSDGTSETASVDTYNIEINNAAGTGLGNYDINYTAGTFTVNKAALTITAEDQSKTYDGSAFTTFTASYDGFVDGEDADDLSGTLTFGGNADGAENMGEYTITAAGLSSDNYNLTFKEGKLEITPRDLSLSNFTASAKTYDGTTTATSIDFEDNRIEGDDLDFNFTAAFENADAGEDKIVNISDIEISGGVDAANYTLLTLSGVATTNITKAASVITEWPDASGITYGDALAQSTLSGGESTTAGTFAFTDDELEPNSAGIYTAEVIFTPDSGNYSSATEEVDVAVARKELTVINAVARNKEYDGNTTAVIIDAELNGVIIGDAVTLQSSDTGTFAQTNTGTEIAVSTAMTLSGGDAANYTLTQPTGLTADITSTNVTGITWPAASDIIYGESLASSELTGGIAEVDGEFTFVDESIEPNTAGTYTADVIFTPDDTDNYSSVTNQVDVEVTPKELTVANAEAQNKEYDGTDIAEITGTELIGVINDDAVELDEMSGSFASASVGEDIEVTAALRLTGEDAANYTLTQPTDLAADITAKEITITGTFIPENKIYDGTDEAGFDENNLELDGVIPADDGDVSLTNILIVFGDENVADNKTVTITEAELTGSKSGNYTLSFNDSPDSEANITPFALTITVNNAERASGANEPVFTFADFSGALVGGDDIADITGGTGTAADVVFTLTSTDEDSETGEYEDEIGIDPVSLDGTKAGNYSISIDRGTLTIIPSDLGGFIVEGISSPTTAGALNTVQVSALDTEGNIKTDYTGTIAFSSSDGIADLPDSYTFLAADNGKREFADEVIFKTSGIHWVEVENPGITGRQENIEVLPAAVDVANNGTLLEILKNDIIADGTAEAEVQLTLLDEFDNPIPDIAVTFSSTGDAEMNAASGTTDENGQYSVTLTNTTAEKVDVTAQFDSNDDATPDKGITNGSPAEITFLSGDAASLAIESGNNQSDTVTQTLDHPLVVKITDSEGNPVEGESVTFTITDTPNEATGQELTNVNAETNADGFATAELTLGTKAGSYKITVSAAGVDDLIFEATAEAGIATQLTFVEQPSDAVAGEEIDPAVTVQLLDEFENTVNSDGTEITLSISGDATLGGDVTISTVNGLASFGDLTVAEAGNYTLAAEAENLDSVESDSFTITAGDADAIVMITQPENSIAGETVEGAPKVRVEDDQSNALSDIEISVTLSSNNFTGTSTIKVTTDENGEAEFDNLIINQAGENYTLTFKVAGVTNLESDEFDVTNAGVFADNSSITANPTSLAAGGTSEVTVILADEFGNAVNGVTDFEIGLGESEAIIDETVSESETAGTYTFTVTNLKAEEVTVNVAANNIEIGDAEIEFTTGGISAANSEITATTPHIADGTDASTITITLKDANNNTISGVVEGDFVLAYGDYAELTEFTEVGDGVYTYKLSNITAEEITVRVTVAGIGLNDMPNIFFGSGAISATNSEVTATSPHTADGEDASTITITLRDGENNMISGKADDIVLSGLSDAIAGTISEDGTSGIYTAELTNTTAEALTITVTADGTELDDKPAITFESGSISASNSSVVATTPHTADGNDASTITIILRDAENNGISGLADDIVLSGIGDAIAGTVTGDGTSGVYTAELTNTTAEELTITTTADKTELDDKPAITFESGSISASNSSAEATTPHTADGEDASTITITLRDAEQNVISGKAGDIVLSSIGDAETGTVSEDGTTGTYTAELTNTTAEELTITITADGTELDDKPAIMFESGSISASNSSAEATSPHTADGNDASTITITLRDGENNVISGKAGDIVLSGLSDAIAGTISEDETSGIYTAELTNTTAEALTITVTADGTELDDKPTITFESGSISATNSSVTATSPHTADGNDASTITITLRDGENNVISGLADDIVLSGLGDAIAGTVTEDGTSGVYTAELTNTTAEELTITISADGVKLNDSPQITFQSGSVSAANSSVSVNPDTVIANGTEASTLTVELRDAENNLISGEAGNVELSGLGGATAGTMRETATAGFYEVEITNTKSEDILIAVTVGSTQLDEKPAITFIPGAISVANSTIEANPDTLSIESNSTIRLTLRDENDNLVTGREEDLELNLSGEASFVNPFSETDIKSGIYEAVITNTKVEQITATAKEKAGVDIGNVAVTFTAGAVANLVIQSGNDQSHVVTDTLNNPLIVLVTDADGNPVAGVEVGFTISTQPQNSEDAALINIISTTDSEGLASAGLKLGTKAGSYQVTVNSAGLDDVIFEARAIAGEAVAGKSSATIPDGKVVESTEITITVQDVYENAVSGMADKLDISISGVNAVSEFSEIEDHEDGTYAVTYTPMKPGLDEFEITLNDNAISGHPYTSTVVAGDLKSLVLVSGDAQTQVVARTLDDSLVVQVLDIHDLPIPGKEIEFNISGLPDGAEMHYISNDTVTSDENGLAKIQFSLGNKSGEYIISVKVDTLSPVHFSAFATAGPVSNFAIAGGNNQEQPTLSTLNDSLSVSLFDEYENPIVNEPVAFNLFSTPELSEGSEFSADTTYSNSSGIASTSFKLGDTGGLYEISANIYNQQIDSLLFNATAINKRTNPTVLDTVNTVVFNGDMNTFMYAEPSKSLDSLQNYTLEIWILPTSVDDYFELFSKQGEEEDSKQFLLSGQNNRINATVHLKEGNPVTLNAENIFDIDVTEEQQKVVSTDSVTYKWTHLAFTVDNENKRVNLYKNGFRIDASDFEGEVNQGQARLEMGRGFDGEVHEVRVWDKNNNRNEIQSRMTQLLSGNEDHLVLYHTFDDEGDVASDLTDNGNNLHLGNGVGRNFSVRGITDIEMFENEQYIMAYKATDEFGSKLNTIIDELPKNGKLFQVTNNGTVIGDEITTVPTMLTDVQNRTLYRPNTDYHGRDSVQYSLRDELGNTAGANRKITIYSLYKSPTPFVQMLPLQNDSVKVAVRGDETKTAVTFNWEPSASFGNSTTEYLFSIWNEEGEREYVDKINEPSYSLKMKNSILRYGKKYTWRVEATDGRDTTRSVSDMNFVVAREVPLVYQLHQNYPNPFNPTTKIEYWVPVTSKVKIEIFDVLGRLVQLLVDEDNVKTGTYQKTWNANGLSSGVYFYRMSSEGINGSRFVKLKQMTLIK
ncbi:MAG: MBG domain-containing protein [Balneolaceae bacterium]